MASEENRKSESKKRVIDLTDEEYESLRNELDDLRKEQDRLKKEKQQREEEEAKKKAREAEQQAHRDLYIVYEDHHDKIYKQYASKTYRQDQIKMMMNKHKGVGEYWLFMCDSSSYASIYCTDKIVITNMRVLLLSSSSLEKMMSHPVYRFTNALTLAQIQLLESNNILQERGDTIIRNRLISNQRHSEEAAEFEAIIRIIPGSYPSLRWKPLCGFFRSYYNASENRLIPNPPCVQE